MACCCWATEWGGNMEREALLAYIDGKNKEIDDLSARYAGVRPAWVGEEIGILTMYRNHAIKQLESIK